MPASNLNAPINNVSGCRSVATDFESHLITRLMIHGMSMNIIIPSRVVGRIISATLRHDSTPWYTNAVCGCLLEFENKHFVALLSLR